MTHNNENDLVMSQNNDATYAKTFFFPLFNICMWLPCLHCYKISALREFFS